MARKEVTEALCGYWHNSEVFRLATDSMNIRMSVNMFLEPIVINAAVINLLYLHTDTLLNFSLGLKLRFSERRFGK